MTAYQTRLSAGITRTKEFQRKRLAAYAVNVGTKCGHGCTYCSTGALLRMHRSFLQVGRSPFERGFAIVDPETPDRVARDARRIRRRGMVQLCTTVDAWAPEAQEHHLGRRCLEAILAQPGWTVRILTKNAAVAEDFDFIGRHRDRVLVGLSITAGLDQTDIIAAVEPNASPIPNRIGVLKQAHARGLRTYAMFCPLLPSIAASPGTIKELVGVAVECGAEEVFAEPVNPRGPGLRLTQEALHRCGYSDEAAAVARIRTADGWSQYVAELVANLQHSVKESYDIHRLRILIYPSRLSFADAERIRCEAEGVVWLG